MVKSEGVLYCKEKIKPALFADGMIAYIENSKDSSTLQ
jgi:hypothetical protein